MALCVLCLSRCVFTSPAGETDSGGDGSAPQSQRPVEPAARQDRDGERPCPSAAERTDSLHGDRGPARLKAAFFPGWDSHRNLWVHGSTCSSEFCDGVLFILWCMFVDPVCDGEPSKTQELWKTASLDRNLQLNQAHAVKRYDTRPSVYLYVWEVVLVVGFPVFFLFLVVWTQVWITWRCNRQTAAVFLLFIIIIITTTATFPQQVITPEHIWNRKSNKSLSEWLWGLNDVNMNSYLNSFVTLLCVCVGVLVGRDFAVVVLSHWEKELPWSSTHWDCFSTSSVLRCGVNLIHTFTLIRKLHTLFYLSIWRFVWDNSVKWGRVCLLSVECAMGSWATPLQGPTWGFETASWAATSATWQLGVRKHDTHILLNVYSLLYWIFFIIEIAHDLYTHFYNVFT